MKLCYVKGEFPNVRKYAAQRTGLGEVRIIEFRRARPMFPIKINLTFLFDCLREMSNQLTNLICDFLLDYFSVSPHFAKPHVIRTLG